MNNCKAITWRALSRKREFEDDKEDGKLARVMGLFDLTALGVGATLGLGIYVLAGSVAKETAGPAVCISFLIAAIASAFAGMCYAEFASRVPKAGSAYIYSYVTVGELLAFIIGWNLILEYVIGTASVARGLSSYIDNLLNNVMAETLREQFPMNVSFLSAYPDFFAFAMVVALIVLLSVGARESSILNNVLVIVNLSTIMVIVVAGSIKADPSNWFISVLDIPTNVTNTTNVGTGGFMPFGFGGVMTGAATCFYGFVGFDAVATTGEEAKNPQKNIPMAIIISLGITFVAYFSTSTVLTMVWPYYSQNVDAPFPYVFDQLGWSAIKMIVNIGAIFALCTSLLGSLFPLPRIFYAMGADGIIFKFFANVDERTKTPIIGTVVSGLLTGLMTLIFNVHQLIAMMSIGTLLAYTIVSISVLILRYQEQVITVKSPESLPYNDNSRPWNLFARAFNLNNLKEPSEFSSNVAKSGVVIFSILVIVFGMLLKWVDFESAGNSVAVLVILSVVGLLLILTMIAIGRQPNTDPKLAFKVPLVPLIPCLSIFINLYLMLQLDRDTWFRFAIWMIIGFCIYFGYGVCHSRQGKRNSLKEPAIDNIETRF